MEGRREKKGDRGEERGMEGEERERDREGELYCKQKKQPLALLRHRLITIDHTHY